MGGCRCSGEQERVWSEATYDRVLERIEHREQAESTMRVQL